MHDDVRKVIRESISEALKTLETSKMHYEYVTTYEEINTGIHGHPKKQPSFDSLNFGVNSSYWAHIKSKIEKVFQKYYPQYIRGFWTPLAQNSNMNFDQILNYLITEYWNRYLTVVPSEEKINCLVDEFSKFIDEPKVRMIFVVPLWRLGFDRDLGEVCFGNGITLRHFTNEELTKYFGGPVERETLFSRTKQLHRCALFGEFDEPKLFQNSKPKKSLFYKIQDNIDKVLLSMRAFKNGVIGYSDIVLFPKTFCPLYFRKNIFFHENIQLDGGYRIEQTEVEKFESFMKLALGDLHITLEMACSRLSDAEKRLKPQDKLIDAVIGLESILLWNKGADKIKEGLTERFATNFASLFQKNERSYRFREATKIYGLRSKIIHGMPVKPKLEAADRACAMLRIVINEFLPYGLKPPYVTDKEYWS